jgi:hypothetical protein
VFDEVIDRQSLPDGAAQESLINGSLISCGSSRNRIAYRDHWWWMPGAATSAAAGLALRELNSWDGPFPIVVLDRNSQAVKLVKPNFLHRPGNSIGEDYGRADKLGLGLLELAEDRGRTNHHSWHEVLPQLELERRCLYSKGAQVVAGARQPGVKPGTTDRAPVSIARVT